MEKEGPAGGITLEELYDIEKQNHRESDKYSIFSNYEVWCSQKEAKAEEEITELEYKVKNLKLQANLD